MLYFGDIMFGIGLPEMILILALALIVVGPDKLPELARSVAKGVLELKKTVSSLKENLAEDNPFDSVKPELEEAAKSLKEKLADPVVEEWKGILPDEGVNPLKTEEHDAIIEGDLLTEHDKESLDNLKSAEPVQVPDDTGYTDSETAEEQKVPDNSSSDEKTGQNNESSTT